MPEDRKDWDDLPLEGKLDRLKDTDESQARDIASIRRRLSQVQDDFEALQKHLDRIEELVDVNGREYDQLTTEDKLNAIREALIKGAKQKGHDKSSMDYKEVWNLFDREPSPGHCYDLMGKVGNLDGFEYGKNKAGNRVVKVDLSAVNADQDLFSVKTERRSTREDS